MAKGLTVKVDGVDDVRRALQQASGRIHDAVEQAVGDELRAVADDMRDQAPKRTGALRESIRVEHSGLSGRTAASARHATFVEFGTSRAPAQPYATPTAETARRRFPGRVTDALRSGLK